MQTSSLPEWVQYLQALAVPSIGLLAAAVAYFQWNTARTKVILDLYDRRIEAVQENFRLIEKIMELGESSENLIDPIRRSVEKLRFLFGEEVRLYMALLIDRADKYRRAKKLAEQDPTQTNIESREAAKATFKEIYADRFNVLEPYLALKYRRQWWLRPKYHKYITKDAPQKTKEIAY